MSVSITLVRTLVEALDRAGADQALFFREARLAPADLQDADRRIEVPRYDELQLLALRMTGDPALGIHMAEQASLATFDILGTMSLHAPTMRDGIQILVQYHRIVSDCPDSELVEDGALATLRYDFPRSHPRCNQVRAEFGLTVLLRIAQAYVGGDKLPTVASFEHAEPSYRAEYTRVFGGAERFGEPFTGLVFDRAWLDRPQLHQNPDLFSVLQTQAARKLTRVSPNARIADRVRAQLLALDLSTRPAMDAIARRLGMSARSLRRRLTEENDSFSALVEEALGIRARDLLDDPSRSIQQVAYTMGFSEPSAFHRAFKRWTGMTPRQYREAPRH